MMYEKEQALRKKVRQFAEAKFRSIAAEVDEMDDISWEVVKSLAEEGIFKYLVPSEYGGVGLECAAWCIIREELARVCIQADDTFIMSGLASYPILRFGTEEQKRKYLPSIASGETIGSFASTEPAHGSDIANIETIAVPDGDHYLITGQKCFISNGAGAGVCPVFVRTGPEKGAKGLSAFIIDVKKGGIGLTTKGMRLMGPHPAYELIFDNYSVPKSDMLGEPGMGIKIALTNLNMGRVTVGAAAVGMAQAALEEALSYSRRRIAFDQPLIDFQVTQFKLAEMATNIEAARALVLAVARNRDAGMEEREVIKYASMAKLFATEAAQKVIDEALQIHGGRGLMKDTRIQQIFRGVRALRIYEGASEIQKLTIGRMLRKEAN